MSKIEEIWKDVKGFEGLYEVSDLGNIRSITRIVSRGEGSIHIKGRSKLSTINNRGYLSLTLCKNGKYKHVVIHRLVAEAFIKNPEQKLFTNHKDGNKLNNTAVNLEMIS